MSRFQNLSTGVVVSVADEKDDRFINGWKPYDGTDTPPKSAAPDKSWKVADLKAYAEENAVDLGDATKKEDIVAAIELHIEAAAAGLGSDG